MGNTRDAVKELVTWGALSDGSVFDQGWTVGCMRDTFYRTLEPFAAQYRGSLKLHLLK